MKQWLSCLAVLALFFVPSRPTLALTADEIRDIKSQFESLDKEKKALDAQQAVLDKKAKDIEWVGSSLSKNGDTIRAEGEGLKRAVSAFVIERGTHNRNVDQYNSECNRRFTLPDEEAGYDECNRRKDYYDRKGTELESTRVRLSNDTASFDKVWSTYQEVVKTWIQDANTLRDKQIELDQKYEDWQYRSGVFTQKEAFQQLLREAGNSRKCADIPGIGTFTPGLNGPSERAVRCLQRYWDGAAD